jgi:hypothetical protein
MGKKKYSFNEGFFDNLTPESCYFLGWLMSDGSIYKKYVSLTIQERDVKILETLRNYINYSGPLYFQKRNRNLGVCDGCVVQHRYRLQIYSEKLVSQLKSLGLCKDKGVNLEFPVIPESSLKYFLRGMYEGDGTFSYSSSNGILRFEIHLISSIPFCESLISLLHELDFNPRKDYSKKIKVPHCIVKISGNLSSLRFFNYIYDDNCYILDRKLDKFVDLINYMDKHRHRKNISKINETLLESKRNLTKILSKKNF